MSLSQSTFAAAAANASGVLRPPWSDFGKVRAILTSSPDRFACLIDLGPEQGAVVGPTARRGEQRALTSSDVAEPSSSPSFSSKGEGGNRPSDRAPASTRKERRKLHHPSDDSCLATTRLRSICPIDDPRMGGTDLSYC